MGKRSSAADASSSSTLNKRSATAEPWLSSSEEPMQEGVAKPEQVQKEDGNGDEIEEEVEREDGLSANLLEKMEELSVENKAPELKTVEAGKSRMEVVEEQVDRLEELEEDGGLLLKEVEDKEIFEEKVDRGKGQPRRNYNSFFPSDLEKDKQVLLSQTKNIYVGELLYNRYLPSIAHS